MKNVSIELNRSIISVEDAEITVDIDKEVHKELEMLFRHVAEGHEVPVKIKFIYSGWILSTYQLSTVLRPPVEGI